MTDTDEILTVKEAAQVLKVSDKTLYTALEIGKPDKLSVTVDLDKLVEEAGA